MKANSLPGRDKEHKRTKDICDIFALVWYSGIILEEINFMKYISQSNLNKILKSISDDDFEKAALQVGHSKDELKRVFSRICESQ